MWTRGRISNLFLILFGEIRVSYNNDNLFRYFMLPLFIITLDVSTQSMKNSLHLSFKYDDIIWNEYFSQGSKKPLYFSLVTAIFLSLALLLRCLTFRWINEKHAKSHFPTYVVLHLSVSEFSSSLHFLYLSLFLFLFLFLFFTTSFGKFIRFTRFAVVAPFGLDARFVTSWISLRYRKLIRLRG